MVVHRMSRGAGGGGGLFESAVAAATKGSGVSSRSHDEGEVVDENNMMVVDNNIENSDNNNGNVNNNVVYASGSTTSTNDEGIRRVRRAEHKSSFPSSSQSLPSSSSSSSIFDRMEDPPLLSGRRISSSSSHVQWNHDSDNDGRWKNDMYETVINNNDIGDEASFDDFLPTRKRGFMGRRNFNTSSYNHDDDHYHTDSYNKSSFRYGHDNRFFNHRGRSRLVVNTIYNSLRNSPYERPVILREKRNIHPYDDSDEKKYSSTTSSQSLSSPSLSSTTRYTNHSRKHANEWKHDKFEQRSITSRSSVIIRNLDSNIDDHSLTTLFSKCGTVVSCKVERGPLPTATVHFLEMYAADDAVKRYHGKIVDPGVTTSQGVYAPRSYSPSPRQKTKSIKVAKIQTSCQPESAVQPDDDKEVTIVKDGSKHEHGRTSKKKDAFLPSTSERVSIFERMKN